jgi:hypothetical protein
MDVQKHNSRIWLRLFHHRSKLPFLISRVNQNIKLWVVYKMYEYFLSYQLYLLENTGSETKVSSNKT